MTRRGVPYNNTYCWVYRFGGGKIRSITEYLDTELVTRAFG
jgi:ketosteroid isomerase-like protein